MILYFAADLLWASKIKSTADALTIPCRPVRSVEMLEARLADGVTDPCPAKVVRALLVDLDKPDEAFALVRRLRDERATPRERQIHVFAWGPHVAKELLQAARDEGANQVLTRGAFDHAMDATLRLLSGGLNGGEVKGGEVKRNPA